MPTAEGQFDYIVVGAGSAGATLAARLTESGAYRVLLLEAGVEESSYFWSRIPVGVSKMIDLPAVNWCFSAEPDEGSGGRRIEVPRGKMLGGSSSINGMVYIRGHARDYSAPIQFHAVLRLKSPLATAPRLLNIALRCECNIFLESYSRFFDRTSLFGAEASIHAAGPGRDGHDLHDTGQAGSNPSTKAACSRASSTVRLE